MGNGQSIMHITYSEEQFEVYLQTTEQNDYKIRDFHQYQAFKKEIETFHPCLIKFTMSEQEGNYYFEYANLFLEHPTLDFRISRNQKKYSIYCESIRHLKNIEYYHIKACEETLTAPQQIGVLTAKKINAWIKYYEDLYVLVAAKSKEHGAVRAAFMQSIDGLAVNWNHDKDGGSLVDHGIELKFRFYPAYVRLELGIQYSVSSTVDNFIKLSQNKY